MEWLKALYIGATIFGAGVTIADMIGVFANLGQNDSDDVDGEGEVDGDGDADVDVDVDSDAGDGYDDAGDTDGSDGDGAEGDGAVGDEADSNDSGDSRGSLVAHDRRQRRNPVISLLTALRTLVYFALGFGPVGWFATTQYPALGTTLLWSLPMGVAVAVGTRALRSFMRRDLTSTITKEDIIMEKGEVTVSIGAGAVGRVRINMGGVYVDRFAKAVDSSLALPTGTTVRVADSDDEYVYVEIEES